MHNLRTTPHRCISALRRIRLMHLLAGTTHGLPVGPGHRVDHARLPLPGAAPAQREPAACGEREGGGVARIDHGHDLRQPKASEAVVEKQPAKPAADAAAPVGGREDVANVDRIYARYAVQTGEADGLPALARSRTAQSPKPWRRQCASISAMRLSAAARSASGPGCQ